MNRGRIAVYVTLLFGVPLALTACREAEGGRASAQPTLSSLTRSQPPAAGSLRAWFDPQTGSIGTPPDAEFPNDSRGAGAATDPLVLQRGRTKAGGNMVDLRGRFVYSQRASVLPDGDVVAGCDQGDEADHAQ